MKKMTRFFKVSGLLILGVFFLPKNTFSQTPALKFKNHQFKIVQFTDFHWIVGNNFFRNGDDSSMSLMRYVILKEKPDLVVLTGDNVVSPDAIAAWKEVTQPFTDFKVPFLVAFGNHDTETDITKRQALSVIRSNPYNLTYDADTTLTGVGNCALPILDEIGKKDKWVIYMFDSNAYSKDTLVSYYDWIHNDQIQWYRKQSAQYTRMNGRPLPSLAFFHIPLPEFSLIGHLKSTVGTMGEKRVGAPRINSGLFASFIEMKDICGVFVGHDHNNDFAGVLDNICLAYGRKTGFNAPYHEILEKGARVIKLYDDGKKFDSYIVTRSGHYLDFTFDQTSGIRPAKDLISK